MLVKRNAPITSKGDNTEGDRNSPYVLTACVTSPAEDSYGTVMGKTTRDNVERQANEGRQVCPNHVKECAIGITANASQDGNGLVYCELHIDRGVDLLHQDAGYPNTDILIRQIAAGRIKDTSIGGTIELDTTLDCNVCERDMLTDFSCIHWPKQTYEIEKEDPTNPKKKIIEQIRCTPSWENLGLGEISTCWAGANPDAEIMLNRANMLMERGLLKKSVAARLNFFYGIDLDLSRAKPDSTIFDMGQNNGGEKPMTDEERQEMERLRQEAADAKSAQQAAEAERDRLKSVDVELQKRVDAAKREGMEMYKEFRGANMTSADMRAYEEKQDKLTLSELEEENDFIAGALGYEAEEEGEENKEGEEDGNNDENNMSSRRRVKPGRSTSDKDNSNADGDDNRILPPFMRNNK